jgi:hypothetical protein
MTTIKTYDEYPFGLSWVTDETVARTSHALVAEGRVWLVDPVDAGDALKRVAGLGEPAAVLQLLDRHDRDCAAVAERLGVLHVKVPDTLPGSPFEVIRALRVPGWQETALWWPEQRALIVSEVVGTAFHYTGGLAPVGMHIMLRPLPPQSLRGRQPEHLLVGHGRGVHGADAAAGLEEAYRRARSDLPGALKALAGRLRKVSGA